MYEKLIQALRCCTSPHGKCEECSYFKIGACHMQTQMDAADAIEELQKAVYFHKYNSEFWEDKYNSLADEKWIPVTKQLPEPGEVVIGYNGRRRFITIVRVSGVDGITHWTSLPEPPKEET